MHERGTEGAVNLTSAPTQRVCYGLVPLNCEHPSVVSGQDEHGQVSECEYYKGREWVG